MAVTVWLLSQRLVIPLATVFMVGAVGYAVSRFWGADAIPPGAAVAYLGIAAIGVAGFVISLPAAWAFRRGGTVKTAEAVGVIGAGTVVYTASGFFTGFLPLFVIAAVIGGLALYEEHGQK